MLAMNDEGVVFLFGLGLFITIWVWMGNRHKLREHRLKIIQQALDHATLDDATRRTLIESLGAEHRSEWMRGLGQHLGFLARNLLFIGGWITMFVGGAILAYCTFAHDPFGDGLQIGAITSAVGFALVTFPFAIRELDRGKAREHA
jgi:hypothetical protein